MSELIFLWSKIQRSRELSSLLDPKSRDVLGFKEMISMLLILPDGEKLIVSATRLYV